MTILKKGYLNLGSIATTKLLQVTSNELIYTIGSGNLAFEATNLGPAVVMYGNSAVSLNSGGLLAVGGSKFWDTIVGNFTMYFVTTGNAASGRVVIQEYAGN